MLNSVTSWGAVSHGALLRGLDKAKIEKRVARFHYGIPCYLHFRPGIDDENDRIPSPFNNKEYFVPDCVLWILSAVRASIRC